MNTVYEVRCHETGDDSAYLIKSFHTRLVVRLGLMALRARPEGFTGSACGSCMLGPQMLRARLQKIAPNFFKLDSGDATTSSRASLDVVRRIGHNYSNKSRHAWQQVWVRF